MPQITPTVPDRNQSLLSRAVHRYGAFSWDGLQERLFTALFSGLVYPQIWEDPEVDLDGLALAPGARVVTISSGGCNALSYLTADPGDVIAVDLNRHHVHLARLKRAGLRELPNYQTYFRFFGEARDRGNSGIYRRHLRDKLPEETRDYWDSRDILLRRRISIFGRDIYRQGLLGRFIWLSHLGARVLGARLAPLLEMRDVAEQQAYFDKELAPLFDHWLVQRTTKMKASPFGLGIPPAQYDSLAEAGDGDMAVVLKERLRKLCCDFPIADNYFAQQAFGRRYPGGDGGPLPLYLQSGHFETLRERANRLDVVNCSVTDRLKTEDPGSIDAVVLLDAQDWMTDEQLGDLWTEIGRTAKPNTRVLFRTADLNSLLPGRLAPELLEQWAYQEDRSKELTAADRSAIYGGVHLYRRAV